MKTMKLLFMDVDGTLTDGKLYMGHQGEAFKAFDIKDGYGIANILPQYAIIPVIITARESAIVANRCRELRISQVYQGCKNKRQKMIEVAENYGLQINDCGIIPGTAYIGDDIPDLPCMELARYAGCPADAAEEIKARVHFVSAHQGGSGAVRDFIEWLVKGLTHENTH